MALPRRKLPKRGPRRKIVGEALVRPAPGQKSELYEVLACGHYQRGIYNKDGMSCDRMNKRVEVRARLCSQCLRGEPKGPPGEVVEP